MPPARFASAETASVTRLPAAEAAAPRIRASRTRTEMTRVKGAPRASMVPHSEPRSQDEMRVALPMARSMAIVTATSTTRKLSS